MMHLWTMLLDIRDEATYNAPHGEVRMGAYMPPTPDIYLSVLGLLDKSQRVHITNIFQIT